MKTTIDIEEDLLQRAMAEARRRGISLRELVEEGLRMVVDPSSASGYSLPDLSVGDRDADNPLERMTWAEVRSEIHGHEL